MRLPPGGFRGRRRSAILEVKLNSELRGEQTQIAGPAAVFVTLVRGLSAAVEAVERGITVVAFLQRTAFTAAVLLVAVVAPVILAIRAARQANPARSLQGQSKSLQNGGGRGVDERTRRARSSGQEA